MGLNKREVGRLTSAVLVGAVLLGTPLASARLTAVDAGSRPGTARNVIFINGDGMGAAHREAARLFLTGFDGQLVMDQLSASGQLTTSPHDPATVVTDSAAGASAWATGEKTYLGAISVDVTGKPLPTLGAQAKAAGLATGLVTTAQVTDATPAAFFANAAGRDPQDEIARQYVEVTRPDIILGGGEDEWLPVGDAGAYPDNPATDPGEASSSTKGNLVRRAVQTGYQYVSSAAELQRATGSRLLGLFANEEMFEARAEGAGDRYQPTVPLATMTAKALEVLDRSHQGFFLVVEEEGVDEFSHRNNATRTLESMASLDRAVAVARAYVAQHPDTLLIVAGDHECGGLVIEDPWNDDESGDGISTEDGPFPIKGSNLAYAIDWTTTHHTSVDTPVTAEGPESGQFTGKHPNTQVYDVISRIITRH